ncbi:hypothetical protein QCD71_25130, partial [Sphingomonas sp. PsM26]|nr:hypothetical protein [Sphingomonas sp. PsM26]
AYTAVLSSSLAVITAPVQIVNNQDVLNITSVAQNGSANVYYEIDNGYGYNTSINTNYIECVNVTSSGVVGTAAIIE